MISAVICFVSRDCSTSLPGIHVRPLPACTAVIRCSIVVQTGTDYGPYLANEPSPLHTTTIVDRCTQKLVDDWNKMRTNVSARPLLLCCLWKMR